MAQPSAFGALLRRSKFASYDPAISQIYTAPPSHAHRGDFGFKRPMPRLARKRAAHVVVMNVDTREYQTEWSDAEKQAKFVQRLDETGANWGTTDPWRRKSSQSAWDTDSDFDRSSSSTSRAESLATTADYNYMSPKQFEHFVEKTRELRPSFYEYLEQQRIKGNKEREVARQKQEEREQLEYGISRPKASLTRSKHHRIESERISLYAAAQVRQLESEEDTKAQNGRIRALYMPRKFLTSLREAQLMDPSSPLAVAPSPHRHAGLSYHHPSRLQNVLTSPPVPGWVLPTANYKTGYMAPPPGQATSGVQPKNLLSRHDQSYVAHVGGSYAAVIPRADIYDEPTGQTAVDQRVEPFSFFQSSSTSAGQSTFRPIHPTIMAPPTVVHDGTGVGGASTNQRDRIRSLGLDRSIRMTVAPWATVADLQPNPHVPGTPAYIAHQENISKNWKGQGQSHPSSYARSRKSPPRASSLSSPFPSAKQVNSKLMNTLTDVLQSAHGQSPKRR